MRNVGLIKINIKVMIKPSTFQVEFTADNKARFILESPLKVNCIKIIELLDHDLSHALVIAFYNQVRLANEDHISNFR
jgi:hypothetical protein